MSRRSLCPLISSCSSSLRPLICFALSFSILLASFGHLATSAYAVDGEVLRPMWITNPGAVQYWNGLDSDSQFEIARYLSKGGLSRAVWNSDAFQAKWIDNATYHSFMLNYAPAFQVSDVYSGGSVVAYEAEASQDMWRVYDLNSSAGLRDALLWLGTVPGSSGGGSGGLSSTLVLSAQYYSSSSDRNPYIINYNGSSTVYFNPGKSSQLAPSTVSVLLSQSVVDVVNSNCPEGYDVVSYLGTASAPSSHNPVWYLIIAYLPTGSYSVPSTVTSRETSGFIPNGSFTWYSYRIPSAGTYYLRDVFDFSSGILGNLDTHTVGDGFNLYSNWLTTYVGGFGSGGSTDPTIPDVPTPDPYPPEPVTPTPPDPGDPTIWEFTDSTDLSTIEVKLDEIIRLLKAIGQYLEFFAQDMEDTITSCATYIGEVINSCIDYIGLWYQLFEWYLAEILYRLDSLNTLVSTILFTLQDFDTTGAEYTFVNDPEINSKLNDLVKRFPASIPWDIAAMLALLKHEPVAPSFEIEFGDYCTFAIDCEDFPELAVASRNGSYMTFVFMLAYATPKLSQAFRFRRG